MPFRNLTLKRKLVGIIFLTSVMVLLLTCVILFYYEVQSYRKTTVRSLSSIADIVSQNSTATLTFDYPKVAMQILSGLRAEPEITSAALYDTNGILFATYPTNMASSRLPSSPRLNTVELHANYLAIYKPILVGTNQVGTLFLRGNLNLGNHLEMDAVVLLIVLAASGALGLLLSNLFQRQISQPLLNLAGTAKTISEQKDYSVRGVKTSNDEIGELTEAFNSMLDQIQKSHNEVLAAVRAKDDFLAALSHDLRTPLNPVLLLASDFARDSDLPEETREAFEMIQHHVELEARLIDDLLDLTRITRGKMHLKWQPVEVHQALREAIATVRAEAEKKKLGMKLVFDADRHVIFGDLVRLEQVFWNILKNSVKFTPAGGMITVKTFADKDALTIKMSDTGIGMSETELVRVFDPFAQGDHIKDTPHRFGGIGLGLSISRTLIELHSGSIRAESAGPGHGATFTIQLPLARKPRVTAVPRVTAPPVAAPAAPQGPNGEPLSILLVEDHEPTRAVLAQLLVRRRCKVTEAASVVQARLSAEKNEGRFDLVISDIGLPDGSGYNLMHELRERYHLKGIALTGYGMEQDIARAHDAGFVAHLTKPVRIEALDGVLATSLSGPGTSTHS